MQDPEPGERSDRGRLDWPLADSTQIRLFYVGHDERELGGVAAYAASEYDGITLVTDTDVEAAIETVRRWPFDCVVVQSDAPEEEWSDLVTEAVCPVILYTDLDGDEVSPALRDEIETVVERRSDSYRALFAHVVGVARSPGPTESRAGSETVQALEADSQETTGCFLVDGDGRIRWSNVSLKELFREGDYSGDDRAPTHFYRRLAAIFEGGPETAVNLTSMLAEDRRRHGKVLRAPVGDRMEFFLHSSYPVLGQADLRFEVISRISGLVESYDRVHLFEELADNAVDGLFALDANGYVDYCNRSYAAMAGYDPGELVGRHVSTTMAEGEVERAQRALQEIRNSERESETLDLTIETADGDAVDASYHFRPRETADGEYAGLIGVVRDVSERKARERELEEYRTLVESAGDPMYVTDEDGDIVVLNEALVDFTGLPRERLHGMNVAELHTEENLERARRARQRIREADDHRWESFEVWLTDGDGDERLFEVTVGAVLEAGFAGTVATFRDITERHRKQEKIELLKEVFARSLRHNIRNEASVIEGFATVLADRVDDADRELVERIRAASRSLAATSEKVSDLDWIVDGEFDVVAHDLPALLRTSLDSVDDAAGPEAVTLDLPADVRVRGIRDLDVAVRNLVENALEHGHVDGDSDVTVTVSEMDESWVTLTVADDGPGIPEQEVRVIERSEETALEHGSGLGLWLVDQVVTQSGGDLSFEVGDGTRAHVRLRRADAA